MPYETKKASGSSISEAIADLIEFGEVRNKEVAETHYELLRQAQGDPLRNSFAVRSGKSLCLDFERFRRRQLSVTGTLGVDRKAMRRAGALITECSRAIPGRHWFGASLKNGCEPSGGIRCLAIR